MEPFGRHTQFLLKQGGVCVKDVAVTKSVCCSCRWSGLWVSAPTLGGSQPPATPLGSHTLWSPQVPACTWHIETQRYISTYIKEKNQLKEKSCSYLCCSAPVLCTPSFAVSHQLPGGWQFTVSTLFICINLGQTAFFTGKAPTSLTSEHEQKYTKCYKISDS